MRARRYGNGKHARRPDCGRLVEAAKQIAVRLVGMQRPFPYGSRCVGCAHAVLRKADDRSVVCDDVQHPVPVGHFGREESESDVHGGHAVVVGRRQPGSESRRVVPFAAPPQLGQCAQARKAHIVEVGGRFGAVRQVEFAEKSGFDPLDTGHLCGRETLGGEIETAGFFGVEYGRPDVAVLFGRLPHIEIEPGPGHHHRAVSFRCCGKASPDALPSVYAGVVGEFSP